MKTLESRLSIVLDRCAKINVTISKLKFEIGDKLHFAAFIIAHDGVRPDPKHTEALAKFPTPTSVRSTFVLGTSKSIGFFRA